MQIIEIVDDLKKHPSRRYYNRPLSWVKGIAVHHSVRSSNPWNVAIFHVDERGWPGIGYHYYIMPGGTIYQTNWLTTISYHVGNPNWESIGMCLDGDFRLKVPTQAQLDSARFLIDHIRNLEDLFIEKIHGHGWYPGGSSSVCPGTTWPEWRDYVKEPLPPIEEELMWIDLDNYIEVLGERNGKSFTTSKTDVGEQYIIPGLPAEAKRVTVRLAVTGSANSWASVGHRPPGAHASLLAAYVNADDAPDSDTADIPVEAGCLYLLRSVPHGGEIKVWVRVYSYLL